MGYKETHPWITFSLSLPLEDFRLWMMLGEIASKVEHLSGVPLRPDVAAEMHRVYLAKGVLATTAIEGNTLSEDQVRAILDGKLMLPKSQQYLQQEVQNIIDACNGEVDRMLSGESNPATLSAARICNYNKDVLRGLTLDEGTVPGEIRQHSVVVGNVYRGAPATDCPRLLERLADWINGPEFTPPDEELRVPFALIRAIIAHLYLAWIHPFGDGNGRTARLVEFHILFASGVPSPAAHLLSDHYNLTRTEYYRQLALSSRNGGDVIPFLMYALQGFLDGIRRQIEKVRNQQLLVAWENYVHDSFRDEKNSPAQRRRRELVLALSKVQDWVAVSLISMLTPRLASEYARAGSRMLPRDLNAIAGMDLISRRHGAVRANVELVQAFLPPRVREEKQGR